MVEVFCFGQYSDCMDKNK